jgi:hypothetical protein
VDLWGPKLCRADNILWIDSIIQERCVSSWTTYTHDKSYYWFCSVCPSFCQSVRVEQLGFHWDGFSLNLILESFSKTYRENSSCIKTWQEWRVLYMKTATHLWSYLTHFFLEWEIFQTNFGEKFKHLLCSWTFCFPRKSFLIRDNVKTYCTDRQTDRSTTNDIHYGACALYAGYLRLQTYTNMLLFHFNIIYATMPQCDVTRTLPFLLYLYVWCVGLINICTTELLSGCFFYCLLYEI